MGAQQNLKRCRACEGLAAVALPAMAQRQPAQPGRAQIDERKCDQLQQFGMQHQQGGRKAEKQQCGEQIQRQYKCLEAAGMCLHGRGRSRIGGQLDLRCAPALPIDGLVEHKNRQPQHAVLTQLEAPAG